ncbi:MAG TPA: hypothetical protein VGM20_01090 [Gemmatimonadales bacterium]|jgi:hypothetical protein
MRRLSSICCFAVIAATACTNAGQKLTYPALSVGHLSVAVYFDRDDSHSLTSADTSFTGATVDLLAPGGSDTLRRATTDAQGVATFDSLPIGSYRVVIDQHALSDSVGTVAGDTGSIRLVTTADSIVATRIIRLGYADLTVAQARAAAPGRKAFVRAAVTVPLQTFRDTSTFLVDSTGSIRVLPSRMRSGLGGDNIGDTVLVLAPTGAALGQPILDNGVITPLSAGAAPAPQTVSVTDARTAKGGTLDAALVKVTGAMIQDTVGSSPDFIVRIADPADSTRTVDVLIDAQLNAPHVFFPIGATVTMEGVLVPMGTGTWVIKPRNAADITIN